MAACFICSYTSLQTRWHPLTQCDCVSRMLDHHSHRSILKYLKVYSPMKLQGLYANCIDNPKYISNMTQRSAVLWKYHNHSPERSKGKSQQCSEGNSTFSQSQSMLQQLDTICTVLLHWLRSSSWVFLLCWALGHDNSWCSSESQCKML